MALQLKSQVFQDGETISARYTADGKDLSPPFEWDGVPEGTQAFVFLCLDPDAPVGTFVHWTLYDIPGEQRQLEEGVPLEETVLGTAKQGKNNFGKIGYGGPAPPPGGPHRYIFYLYAVDAPTGLGPGASKDQIVEAIKGHVLAETQLTGKYGR